MNRAIPTRDVVWLLVALMLALAPHVTRFPLLLSLGFLCAAAWRVLAARGVLPLPDSQHRVLHVAKTVVALAAFIAVYIAYRGKLGREGGIELLAALLGLKLVEMHSERDYFVAAFLGYFLVVTNFFYSQTIATALYMLVVVVGVTAVMVQFNTPPAWRRSSELFAKAAHMTVQALPVMVLAFVLFPRLPGPLWGLPQDALGKVTGLSDRMTIGDITRLGLSNEIAFRVSFHGIEPRAQDRYWRGPVLWHTDGRSWRTASVSDGLPQPIEAQGGIVKYEIMLEAHRERWLVGLDLVIGLDRGMRQTADYALKIERPLRKRMRYQLTSAVDYRAVGLDAATRAQALQLPPERHPRARALVAEWRAQGASDAAMVERALRLFRQEKFYYSLTPPPLYGDAVDQFLFETREGFCEHFSAAFVSLMRAAGIPARVVTGYQGGEYNSICEYMIVRQRDAHAWTEIHDAERGWVRVDPTAAVAPERVSLGIAEALPRGAELAGFERGRSGWSGLRDALDTLTYGWNQWVLGYTPQTQRQLMDGLGFEDWQYGELVIALTVTLAIVLAALALALLRASRPNRDPVVSAYALFCRRLARIGLARAASEPPYAYARRVTRERSDLAAEVHAITRLYTQLRYGRRRRDVAALQRQVQRFRPQAAGRGSR